MGLVREIPTFQCEEVSPARAEFDRLHKIYTKLYGANLLLSGAGAALALLCARELTRS